MSPKYQQIFRLPDCPHLNGKICMWMSQRMGKNFTISPLWCHFVCQKFNGPYCGRSISEEDEIGFTAKFFTAYFMMVGKEGESFAGRVLRHYKLKTSIKIPGVWKFISEDLRWLRTHPNIRNILLTGSLITKASNHKDYDIVLMVNDIKEALSDGFGKELPQVINGIKCDYFYIDRLDGMLFFVSLDCESKTLYKTKWFDLQLKEIDPEIKVVDVGTNGLSSLIEKLLDEEANKQPVRILKPSLQKNVVHI